MINLMKAFSFFLCLFVFIPNAMAEPAALTERPEVKAFVDHMVKDHHFDEAQLNQWLNQATIQKSILTSIAKPAEALPWYRYQTIFLTPQHIEKGVAFWKAHAKALLEAQQKYGVEPEYIVAILGVETLYGKGTGNFKVLDSLSTLAFNYPPRSKFFLSELEEFLLLAREEQWDPTQIQGSYAGAIGIPQFIPSSYRRFAVDFNGNGKRDLLTGPEDAIGSIGNYFQHHGWQPNGLVTVPAKTNGKQYTNLIASKMNPKPSHSLESLSKQGISVELPEQHQADQFALIALEGKNGPEYWLGAQNFYVITRYNHSNLYAMAVYNLSQKVKEKYLSN